MMLAMPEDEYRSDDCVGHASAGFADRLWRLRQERPVDGAHSAIHEVAEDRNERRQYQQHRQDRDAASSRDR